MACSIERGVVPGTLVQLSGQVRCRADAILVDEDEEPPLWAPVLGAGFVLPARPSARAGALGLSNELLAAETAESWESMFANISGLRAAAAGTPAGTPPPPMACGEGTPAQAGEVWKLRGLRPGERDMRLPLPRRSIGGGVTPPVLHEGLGRPSEGCLKHLT